MKYKKMKLSELAEIERAISGKVYGSGTILIMLSATNGQVVYLDHPQKVASKYACILLHDDQIIPYYLYLVVEMALPEFLQKYKADINIQINSFNYFYVNVHNLNDQKQIANILRKEENLYINEKLYIEKLMDLKKIALDSMFV